MHIYMIGRNLSLQGSGDDSLYQLARHSVLKGHKVTVFASADDLDFDLGQKNIGLFMKSGITMVAFNVPFNDQMSSIRKLLADIKYARMAGKQGRLMPKPEMLIAKIPPISVMPSVLRLKKLFDIPLILEVRDIWPDALVQRGMLKNRFLIKRLSNLAKMFYENSDRIVTSKQENAALIRERCSEQEKITAFKEGASDSEISLIYDRLIEELS